MNNLKGKKIITNTNPIYFGYMRCSKDIHMKGKY